RRAGEGQVHGVERRQESSRAAASPCGQEGRPHLLLSHRRREGGRRHRQGARQRLSGSRRRDGEGGGGRGRAGEEAGATGDAEGNQGGSVVQDVSAGPNLPLVGDAGHRRRMGADRKDVYFDSLKPAGTATSAAATSVTTFSTSVVPVMNVVRG